MVRRVIYGKLFRTVPTLGPLHFFIYINSISKLKIGGKLFLFANDTAVVSSGCTLDEFYDQASKDLIKVKS